MSTEVVSIPEHFFSPSKGSQTVCSAKAFLLISKSNLPEKENLANQFRIECDNFTKVGPEISKIVSGSESVLTKKWLNRRNNFAKCIQNEIKNL